MFAAGIITNMCSETAVKPSHSRRSASMAVRQQNMKNTGIQQDNNCQNCTTPQDDGLPKVRIPLVMLQPVRGRVMKVRVVLSIYSTHYDLYAVVSQDCNVIVKDCGYIKLRQCLVSINTAQLTLEITQLKYEGVCMRFQACRRDHLDSIARLLRLSADVENANIFTDIPSPLSASPSVTDSPLRSLSSAKIVTSQKTTLTSRMTSRAMEADRRESMPVVEEDEESESDSNQEEGEEEVLNSL